MQVCKCVHAVCVCECMHTCMYVCVKLLLGFMERKCFHKSIRNLTLPNPVNTGQPWLSSCLLFPFHFLDVSSKLRAWARQGSVHRGQMGMPCAHQWSSQTLAPKTSMKPQASIESIGVKKTQDPPRRGSTFGEGTIECIQCGTSWCEQDTSTGALVGIQVSLFCIQQAFNSAEPLDVQGALSAGSSAKPSSCSFHSYTMPLGTYSPHFRLGEMVLSMGAG